MGVCMCVCVDLYLGLCCWFDVLVWNNLLLYCVTALLWIISGLCMLRWVLCLGLGVSVHVDACLCVHVTGCVCACAH